MKEVRRKIDAIDKKLIVLLAERAELSVQLGKIKKQKGLPVSDKKRETEIIEKIRKLAKKHDLNPLFIKKLYTDIIKESKRIQSHEK
jgi:chorismate mutase